MDLFMHPEPRYGASDRSYGIDTRFEADWEAGRRDALYFTARVNQNRKTANLPADWSIALREGSVCDGHTVTHQEHRVVHSYCIPVMISLLNQLLTDGP